MDDPGVVVSGERAGVAGRGRRARRGEARYRRTPVELYPPFGYADLPCRLYGELRDVDTLAPTFVPHATAWEVAQLDRPWHSHPRTRAARAVLAESLDETLGWRAALDAVDPWP